MKNIYGKASLTIAVYTLLGNIPFTSWMSFLVFGISIMAIIEIVQDNMPCQCPECIEESQAE